MATNRVTYNVGTSNKFAAFYEDDQVKYSGNQQSGSGKGYSNTSGRSNSGFQYRVPYVATNSVPKDAFDNVPSYTEDNITDTRARSRHVSRRFRGNPNGNRRFDRVSGTGRGRELKKQGEGGHNWGSLSKESKSDDEMEENELLNNMTNLNLSSNTNPNGVVNSERRDRSGRLNRGHRNRQPRRFSSNKEEEEDDDKMDYVSYKLLKESKRLNLSKFNFVTPTTTDVVDPNDPNSTDNANTNKKLDEEFINNGYVKYTKSHFNNSTTSTSSSTSSGTTATNPSNKLKSKPKLLNLYNVSATSTHGSTHTSHNTKKNKLKLKVPDVTDIKLFPSLQF